MDNFLRVSLLLAVMVLVGSTVWLSAHDKTGGATVTAGLCIGLCIFTFLYRFKRFKGLGFEGELWEQEMEKAAELRRALQDLSERVGESVFWHMGEGGRWARKDPNKVFGIIERTTRNLRRAGASEQTIEELKRPWHKVVMRDLAQPIEKYLCGLTAKKKPNYQKEMAKLGNPVSDENLNRHKILVEEFDQIVQYPKMMSELVWQDEYERVPELLRREIETRSWLTDEDRRLVREKCTEAFQDIDQYARDRTVRRPEVLLM